MSHNYQRFLKVLEKWPIDKSKVDRDFGEEIRKFTKTISKAESSADREEKFQVDKEIDALERLANNTYAKKYPRLLNSTATGLTVDQCSQVLSTEFLQYLKKK